MKTQKEITKELSAKLREEKKSATISEVAQKIRKEKSEVEAKTVKVRDVTAFVSHKTLDEVQHSNLKTVQQERAYRVQKITDTDFESYDSTQYFNDVSKQFENLSQAIATQKTDSYVQSVAIETTFTAQNIMNAIRTRGGAYGDKIRNALFTHSAELTLAQVEKLKTDEAYRAEIIAKLAELKKDCIRFNVLEESRRKRYNFVRVL